MPSFQCQICQARFDVAQASLDKYAGWTPKYCREHSPSKRPASAAAGSRRSARRGSARRGAGRGSIEENLTLSAVLETYSGGPLSGVFTDGSAVPNPGRGGWGAVWVENGEIRAQKHGHAPQTTNNRMELTALIEAFQMLPEDAEETIYTDSRLCVDTITKWAPNWERNGWTKKAGEIKNLELVQELLGLSRSRAGCTLQWIAAHSGHRWNEYADSLATAWLRTEL